MAVKSLEARRKIRALEAKRDSLQVLKEKAIAGLAQVRADLKHAKK